MLSKEKKLIYQKNVDKTIGKILLPKAFITKWGRSYYMEVYEDKIVILPMKETKNDK